MNKQSKLVKLLVALATTVAVLAFFLPMAFTEESGAMIEEISTDWFANPERPAVPFMHDAHNEAAGIGTFDDCKTCHHYGEGCELEEGAESPGTPCADCHPESGGEACRPELMEAYHQLCWGCHEDKGGPVACGECHVK